MSKLIFGILLIFVFGCTTTNQKQKIKVDNVTEAPSYKEFFKDIELIPLETTDGSLILNANKILVWNNDYFVLDIQQNALFKFNNKGKFIRKINNIGRGPGESTLLSDFEIDYFKKTLLLLSPRGKVMTYNFDGSFISEFRLPKEVRAVHFLKQLSSDILAFYASYDETKLHFYSFKENRIIKKFHKVPVHIQYKIATFRSPFGVSKMGNVKEPGVNFYEPISSQVYELNANGMTSKYSWDFGEYNFDYLNLPEKKMEREELNEFEIKNHSNWAFRFTGNWENDDYIFTALKYKGDWVSLVFDKKLEMYHMFKSTAEKGILTLDYIDDKYGLTIISPIRKNLYLNSQMLNKQNEQIFNNLKETDNPVIIRYNFKD